MRHKSKPLFVSDILVRAPASKLSHCVVLSCIALSAGVTGRCKRVSKGLMCLTSVLSLNNLCNSVMNTRFYDKEQNSWSFISQFLSEWYLHKFCILQLQNNSELPYSTTGVSHWYGLYVPAFGGCFFVIWYSNQVVSIEDKGSQI